MASCGLWGELHANRVQLRSGSAAIVVSVDELVDDPHTGFVDCQSLASNDIGATIDDLTAAQRQQWLEVVGHVHEVLTGFRSGEAADARAGEPRSCYLPDVEMDVRYRAKAEEIGKSVRTIARWVHKYRCEGSGALVDHRRTRTKGVLDSCDRRWVEMCSTVSAEVDLRSQSFEILRSAYCPGPLDRRVRTRSRDGPEEDSRISRP